jgi:hypothetical protein
MNNEGSNFMQNLKKLVLLGAVLGICSSLGTNANAASASCFCKLSCVDLTNIHTASMVVKDYGVLFTFHGPNPQNSTNQNKCNTMCTNKAAPDTGSQAVATAACNLGCPNGSTVKAWSAVGNMSYDTAQYIGTLVNTPAVTQAKCPTGWTCNGCSPQVDGGITSDGKCKKVACIANTITPNPPDGTLIGSWGFTWGASFQAWGTSANGGAPIVTTVTPAQCHF